MARDKKSAQVYTLLVQVGRKDGDGLPEEATGAGLLCFAAGHSEDEAVRETVAVLKTAGLSPIEVTGYGTTDERKAEGQEIGADEAALMDRALEENAVLVVEMMPEFGDGGDAPKGSPSKARAS